MKLSELIKYLKKALLIIAFSMSFHGIILGQDSLENLVTMDVTLAITRDYWGEKTSEENKYVSIYMRLFSESPISIFFDYNMPITG